MTFNRPTLRFSLMLAALLLALPWALSAQTAGASSDEDETNPNYIVITLDDGVAADGLLTADVTAQLYAFDGSAGDIVTVTMTQSEDSSLDPYIVLLGPLGQLVAKDDDSGELASSAQITEVELPANGSYFIIAASFKTINAIVVPTGGTETKISDEEFAYTVSASGFTAPPEEERQFFTSRLVTGVSDDGYSTLAEPVYYFTYVSAEDGEVVDINLTSEQFDTVVMVFGPGGDRIAANDDGEGVGTNSSLIGVVLPEQAKYLMFATDVAFPNAGNPEATLKYKGGDFTIIVTAGTSEIKK